VQVDRLGTDNSDITQRRSGYDAAGELLCQTNALGGVTTYVRTTDPVTGGVIRTTTNPDGGTIIEAYYADGRRKSVTGTATPGKAYSYGTGTDANGNNCTVTTETCLDGSGNPTTEVTETFADMAGRTTEVLFADNSYSQNFYNSLGQLWKQVDPDQVTTLYQYNAKGERTVTAVAMASPAETSPNFTVDHMTATTNFYTFDQGSYVRCVQNFGWVSSGANAGASSLLSFSEVSTNGLNSWQATYRDASVAVTNHTQTVPGVTRVVTAIAPDNSYSISDYQYGQLASVTRYNAGGSQIGATTYAYDPHERQKSVTDARNGATTYAYNHADQPVTVTTPSPGGGPSAETTTTQYDNMQRPYSILQPDGTSDTTVYLPTSQKALEYGSRQYPVGYTYDYAGRLAEMTNWSSFNPGGGSGGTRVTTWNYDAYRGWLNSKVYPDTSATTYQYTPAGRLKTRTWARGVTRRTSRLQLPPTHAHLGARGHHHLQL